jgi:hypothetical protein
MSRTNTDRTIASDGVDSWRGWSDKSMERGMIKALGRQS